MRNSITAPAFVALAAAVFMLAPNSHAQQTASPVRHVVLPTAAVPAVFMLRVVPVNLGHSFPANSPALTPKRPTKVNLGMAAPAAPAPAKVRKVSLARQR